jgi:hypothetical protein
MSTRIDNDGNRTRPHVCGKNCPNDHTAELMDYIDREVDDYITEAATRES